MLPPRSFTFFLGTGDGRNLSKNLLLDMRETAKKMAKIYASPRTLRLTLPAICAASTEDLEADIALSFRWYRLAREHGFRWINQPFLVGISDYNNSELAHNIAALLEKNRNMFSSLNVTSLEASKNAAKLYSRVCSALGRADPHGFANFRFGLGLNIREYTPFFPFSCGDEASVSVALESLPLAMQSSEEGGSVEQFGPRLCSEVVKAQDAFLSALDGSDIGFRGQDWSLAPLPNSDLSVASLIEKISGNPIGSELTLTAVGALTTQLKSPCLDGAVLHTGFNGVMLSVLEDDVLAKRFSHRAVTLDQLLLYSSVCGCGLDMVPLSGSVSEAAISGFATDTASLAYRLGKPLGVRFLPISNLQPGQATSFNHDFVTNADVIGI